MKPPLLPRPIIALAFFFFRNYGKHFFRHFFRYTWWALILLFISMIGVTYTAIDIFSMDMIAGNDVAAMQEHILNVPPLKILLFLGTVAAAFVLSFYIFTYSPLYYLLFTNYQTGFTSSEVYRTFFSRIGRIIVYFFSSILVGIILMIPVSALTGLLAANFLGGILIPLLFGLLLIGFFLSFVEFMTVNCTIVEAYVFGFRTALNKLGRLTINFVFLMFTSLFLTTFIQQVILYISVTLIKVDDNDLITNLTLVAGAFVNVLFIILVSMLQLYVSIGYNEFEMENNYYNSDGERKEDDSEEDNVQ